MNWRESRVMPIDKSGFIYIYTANETDDPAVNAYFDDLKITHKQMVVQADDYYPFGLSIEALSYQRFGGKGNDFKFNSKEADEELGLNWYAYGFRNYDPQLGRWHVQEPLADLMAGISPYAYAYNNPVVFRDLMGLMPGQNRPSYLQSALDTSADSDGDGFVTPSEQFIFDTNNEGGGFDFAKEQNQRRKNKVSLPGGRIIQGDGTDDELFRVIEHGNQRVHIFYESFFAHGGIFNQRESVNGGGIFIGGLAGSFESGVILGTKTLERITVVTGRAPNGTFMTETRKAVSLSDKSRYLKSIRTGNILKLGGRVFGVGIIAFNGADILINGGTNKDIAKFVTQSVITGVGFLGPVGFGVSMGLTALEMSGHLDFIYNSFEK